MKKDLKKYFVTGSNSVTTLRRKINTISVFVIREKSYVVPSKKFFTLWDPIHFSDIYSV